MNKPIAVLISDVHVSLPTLDVAINALKQAIAKANELDVPLVVAGDLHDTKANLRGECIAAIRDVFKRCKTKAYVLVGNHDKINERGYEHSLTFLEDLVKIVSEPMDIQTISANGLLYFFHVIPYYSDVEELRSYLKALPEADSPIVMHQGLNGSNSGEYIQDKSALEHYDVENLRVISGHYHTRQDIKTGRPRKGALGMFSYIGNPYTLNFAEANDPEKGFQILMEDGTLEFVPTNLRRHRVINFFGQPFKLPEGQIRSDDILKVVIEAPSDMLAKYDKQAVAKIMDLNHSFRLDLIPTDTQIAPTKHTYKTQPELLDSIIDGLTNTDDNRKQRLKDLWKGLM